MDEDFPNYKDVLEPTFWPEYEKRMESYFWPQLRRLNTNLYIVDKIVAFPLDLFAGDREETPFFNAVFANFLDMSVLICTRLLLDQDRKRTGTLRLDKFRDEIVKAVKDEYKPNFTARLARIDIKAMCKFVEVKLEPVRNNYIAHAGRHTFGIPINKDQQILIRDLMGLRDQINELFDVFSLDKQYGKLHRLYDPRVMKQETSDIDRILDHIARDSLVLNMPEQQAPFWEEYRAEMSQKDIDTMNSYRAKFGLNAV